MRIMIFPLSRNHARFAIRVVMATTSLLFLCGVFWWLSCAYNYALLSNNYNTNGLYPNDPIIDVKDGSLNSLFTWVNKHSITLVIFYAPWSGQCIKMAPIFLSVYRRLHHRVLSVAAINCWMGTCREKFPTLHFPRVFLYHSTQLPLEYLGEIEVEEILDFIRLSIAPWSHVSSSHELQTFINDNDSCFVAYMDSKMLETDQTYNSFYHATLLMINKVNRPAIAMVTNKTLAGFLKLTHHGNIRSYPAHRQHTYTPQHNYTPEAISSWMVKQTRKLVRVLRPQADKDAYINLLKKGPAAILYSSLSSTGNHLLQKYLNVAVSYHRCHRTIRAQEGPRKTLCMSYLVHGSHICSACQDCDGTACFEHGFFFSMREMQGQQIGQCSSAVSGYFHQYSVCCLSSKVNKSTAQNVYLLRTQRRRMLRQVSILLKYMQEHSMDRISGPASLQKGNTNQSPMSSLLDKYITLREEQRSVCGNSSRTCSVEKLFVKQTVGLLEGLACRTNRSLSFFVSDHNRHKDVLKQMGTPHNPSLLIVDLQKDQHFMLSEQVTATSMASFILRYNLGLLQHNLPGQDAGEVQKTSQPPAQTRISNDNNKNKDHGNSKSNEDTNDNGNSNNNSNNSNKNKSDSIRIMELTSQTFEEVVIEEGSNVFVMFYSAWCGMCKATNLVFLKLVHSYEGKVVFARIDGDKHELPWQYKAPVYPSFLLFPAYRKTFSQAYPAHEDITVENLTQFLDHHSEEVSS